MTTPLERRAMSNARIVEKVRAMQATFAIPDEVVYQTLGTVIINRLVKTLEALDDEGLQHIQHEIRGPLLARMEADMQVEMEAASRPRLLLPDA